MRPSSSVTGTVTGVLVSAGGPAPGAPVPLPGQVVAVSTDGSRHTATAGRSGRYRLSLPPGTYRLTGHSPMVRSEGTEMLCTGAHAIHVTARTTESRELPDPALNAAIRELVTHVLAGRFRTLRLARLGYSR